MVRFDTIVSRGNAHHLYTITEKRVWYVHTKNLWLATQFQWFYGNGTER